MTDASKQKRFQKAVMPHLNSAFNLARWLTRGHQDAEDLVQEAVLRAFKFFDSLQGDNGRVWLLGIVRNTFYNWHHLQKVQNQHTEYEDEIHSNEHQLDDIDNNPETIAMTQDNQRLVQLALLQLPVEFREILVLRELEDLSYKQIAEIMQVPIGTVMSRLGRGRKQLASIIANTVTEGDIK